ncbi:holo-ACP synthase [Paraglaciecola sp. 20A4]|uniref:holo-ACP synthase n=1 Tax=Paraglaciecola sp. 20A4 TaxID=2687288 RepID=UPI00140A21A0|nr:holo-ACP synthase [Paraglaciecola sp. 20A4]
MAVMGLGTDIVEIARIEKLLVRSSRLAQRVLTASELAIFDEHAFPARYLAKRFAAKEAAVKALGIGIGNGISFQDVEVHNLPSGQPFLRFYAKFELLCEQRNITSSYISISDEQSYAVATVILESP